MKRNTFIHDFTRLVVAALAIAAIATSTMFAARTAAAAGGNAGDSTLRGAHVRNPYVVPNVGQHTLHFGAPSWKQDITYNILTVRSWRGHP